MNKKGRYFVVAIGIIVQVLLGISYGFSIVPISEITCFIIWCACAVMEYRFIGAPEVV